VSLRKAYQDMIKVQGIADTATLMGMSESAIDNRVYERREQEFTVRQALRMQQIADSTRFAEAVAEASGGSFVKLPEVAVSGREDLFDQFCDLQSELGQLSATYKAATADGEIDKRERADIERIANDMHRTLSTMTAVMFQLYCREGV
jgi:tellurite resistance protein